MNQFLKAIRFKLYRLARGGFLYLIARKKKNSHCKSVVYFNLKSNPYLRYLSVLVKFFRLEGYDVAFHSNFLFLSDLEDSEAKEVLNSSLAYFVNQVPSDICREITDFKSDTHLSANYFQGLLNQDVDSNAYYVPICMHPLMYHNGLWNQQLPPHGTRLTSILFAGSLNREGYARLSKHPYFSVLNRVEVIDALREGPTFFPNTLEKLANRDTEREIVVVDASKFQIPMTEWRNTLYRYTFFLACPGVIMPFAHNIVEAMSTGTIPIVERGYAELFLPSLQHLENAIVFDGVQDLHAKIQEAFSLPPSKISHLNKNVLEYYHSYLTPQKVIETILDKQISSIYLLAEHNSLQLLHRV
ncbi:MAG: hypothetical protein AAGB19_14475 [Cyanobacteria bacterium P01_F01_bin.3]